MVSTSTAQSWRLPADTDLEALRRQIREAMESKTVLAVPVELNDDPRVPNEILLNGSVLGYAAAVETPDTPAGGTVW
jgi:hypothetical protein